MIYIFLFTTELMSIQLLISWSETSPAVLLGKYCMKNCWDDLWGGEAERGSMWSNVLCLLSHWECLWKVNLFDYTERQTPAVFDRMVSRIIYWWFPWSLLLYMGNLFFWKVNFEFFFFKWPRMLICVVVMHIWSIPKLQVSIYSTTIYLIIFLSRSFRC